jgi:hypothetical protein
MLAAPANANPAAVLATLGAICNGKAEACTFEIATHIVKANAKTHSMQNFVKLRSSITTP